jgi:hypothetical protein
MLGYLYGVSTLAKNVVAGIIILQYLYTQNKLQARN